MARRKPRLHPTWRKWRSQRKRELVAAGLPTDQASRLATAEAAGRSRVARLVGHRAALEAELVIVGKGRDQRVLLKGALQDVPPAQRPRVNAITCDLITSLT